MKSVLNNVSVVTKRLVLVGAAVMLSVSSVAAGLTNAIAQTANVEIEGSVQVANVTAGDTGYSDSVNAKVDQVVKVQVWYHNREDFDSNKIAKNLSVALDVPQVQGKQQTITGTIKGDNTNTVTDSANVNLTLDNAYLDYVEGSAVWKYNKGAYEGRSECQTGAEAVPSSDPNQCYANKTASDDIVNGGVVLNDKMRPCFAYEATVTILLRVKASEVKVNKYVSAHDADHNPENNDWKVKNSAQPGDKMDYMIRFENKGNTVLEDVIVGDNLPGYMSVVPGSTYIINGNFPDGVNAGSDNIHQGGIDVGDYNPGAAGYVVFTVKINGSNVFEHCGLYTLKNVGVVRPAGMNEFYNTAWTDVNIVCEEGEEPQPPVVVTPPENPEQPTPQPETPNEIPATGPASILAGLFGASSLGYGIHTWILSRRRLNTALNQ